jgi:hypothetical protein
MIHFNVLSCLFLERLKKVMKKFGQENHHGQYLSQAPLEYESEALSLEPTFPA